VDLAVSRKNGKVHGDTDILKQVRTFSRAKALNTPPDLSGEKVGTQFIASVRMLFPAKALDTSPDLSGEKIRTRFIASVGRKEGR